MSRQGLKREHKQTISQQVANGGHGNLPDSWDLAPDSMRKRRQAPAPRPDERATCPQKELVASRMRNFRFASEPGRTVRSKELLLRVDFVEKPLNWRLAKKRRRRCVRVA
jgi:hypothetical protein